MGLLGHQGVKAGDWGRWGSRVGGGCDGGHWGGT